MAFGEPKQSPGYRQQDISALARQIKADLKKFGMNQRELATASGIPEARLSRILRGGKVRLTERDINQIALGLKIIAGLSPVKLIWHFLLYDDCTQFLVENTGRMKGHPKPPKITGGNLPYEDY